MTSNCCYNGLVPRDSFATHIQSTSATKCNDKTITGCFRVVNTENIVAEVGIVENLTTQDIVSSTINVENLNVTNSITLPANANVASAIYGILGRDGAGLTISSNNVPVLLSSGTFAGNDVINPTAGSSQFQVTQAGRYEVLVSVTATTTGSSGNFRVVFDGTQIGFESFALTDLQFSTSYYPFLSAGQIVDLQVALDVGGPPANYPVTHYAVKLVRLGDV